MYLQKTTVTVISNGPGGGTGYTSKPINGRVLAIFYDKVDYTDNVDITITSEDTGQAILTLTNVTASAKFYPRILGSKNTDGASSGIYEMIPIANERIEIAILQAGNTKSGNFTIVWG